MTQEQTEAVKRSVSRHPDWHPSRIQKNLPNSIRAGVTTEDVRGLMGESTQASTPAATQRKARVKSLTDFRREHDTAFKLRESIRRLGDGYVTEGEIRTMSQIPIHLWRGTADDEEFSRNKVRANGVWYWAGEKTINEMKEIIGQ